MPTPLADHIRARRAYLDQTQEATARELGCSRPTLVNLEAGTSLPQSKLLPTLARWLQVDGNQVLAWMEEQQAGEVARG